MGNKLTPEHLKEMLHYNPETGVFTWRVSRRGTAKQGTEAGSVNGDGYRRITINGSKFLAHRLAWLYVHGVLPENELDHKNRDKDANWIANLREATRVENTRNKRRNSNNTSGFKGVSWHRAAKKFCADIGIAGKTIHLGLFETAEAASSAYEAAAAKAFGEFYRQSQTN